MRQMQDNTIDLTVTSPPYDNLRSYNGNSEQWNFEKFQDIARELYRVTSVGGLVWVVNDATIKGSETGTSFRQALWFMECGFKLHDTMIWNKRTSFIYSPKRYYQSFEYMFVLSKGTPVTTNLIKDKENKSPGREVCYSSRKKNGDTVISHGSTHNKQVSTYGIRYNVWDIYPVLSSKERTGHPAQFPEPLARDHIISWSNPGDTVFDPFMGSGTTGKMAVLNNRNFIGTELDPQYFQIAVERIPKATICNIQKGE